MHDLLGVSVLRADTHGDLMSVREAVDTTSKAFATGGEDFAYYLNESRAMQEFTAPAHRGHAPNDQGLQAEHHRPVANRHPLHAGCRKHGGAARDLSCGRRRQWA